MVAFAAVYALLWTIYAIVSKSGQGLNPDMAETVVLMHDLAYGYPKHPPFLTWLVALWFSVFSLTEWAYYLLAGLSLGCALYLSFVLAGEWLDGAKRALAPLLLATIPFYNVSAFRFDHNAALMPLWAFTLWAFMRSLATRSFMWGFLTGLSAAAALLTKYWSVWLLMAMAIAAIVHEDRGRYFRSSAPWIAVGIATILYIPHADWLVREDFPPLIYTAGVRGALSTADWWQSLTEYVFGTAGYCFLAMLLAAVIIRPSWHGLRDILLPGSDHQRIAAILFWMPLLLPIPIAWFTGIRLLSIWNMPSLVLFPVIALMSPRVELRHHALTNMAMIVMAITSGALLLSPAIAGWQFFNRASEKDYARSLAPQVTAEWKAVTERPLEFVGGPYDLVNPISFYLSEHPRPYYLRDLTVNYRHYLFYIAPWATKESILRDGAVLVCASRDEPCLTKMHAVLQLGASTLSKEVTVARQWLGLSGPSENFTIAVLKPSETPVEEIAQPKRTCAFAGCTVGWIRDQIYEALGVLETANSPLNLSSIVDWPTFVAAVDAAGFRPSFDVRMAIDELRRGDDGGIRIAGWAADVRGQGAPLNLLVFAAGRLVYDTQTAGERPDVTQELKLSVPSARNVKYDGTFTCVTGQKLIVAVVSRSKRYAFSSSHVCP